MTNEEINTRLNAIMSRRSGRLEALAAPARAACNQMQDASEVARRTLAGA